MTITKETREKLEAEIAKIEIRTPSGLIDAKFAEQFTKEQAYLCATKLMSILLERAPEFDEKEARTLGTAGTHALGDESLRGFLVEFFIEGARWNSEQTAAHYEAKIEALRAEQPVLDPHEGLLAFNDEAWIPLVVYDKRVKELKTEITRLQSYDDSAVLAKELQALKAENEKLKLRDDVFTSIDNGLLDRKDEEIKALKAREADLVEALRDCYRYFSYAAARNLLPEGAAKAMTLVVGALQKLEGGGK